MNNWEEAAMQSKGKRAVALFGVVQDRRGKYVVADIVMQQGKDGYLVYRKTQRKIRNATPKEIDTTKGWKPF